MVVHERMATLQFKTALTVEDSVYDQLARRGERFIVNYHLPLLSYVITEECPFACDEEHGEVLVVSATGGKYTCFCKTLSSIDAIRQWVTSKQQGVDFVLVDFIISLMRRGAEFLYRLAATFR